MPKMIREADRQINLTICMNRKEIITIDRIARFYNISRSQLIRNILEDYMTEFLAKNPEGSSDSSGDRNLTAEIDTLYEEVVGSN